MAPLDDRDTDVAVCRHVAIAQRKTRAAKARQGCRIGVGCGFDRGLDRGRRCSVDAATTFRHLAGATVARCRLGFDPSFKLTSEVRDGHGDVVTLHTHNNRCAVQWQHRAEYLAPSGRVVNAPEAEPVIPTAHASPLEGEHMRRMAYALRCAGRKLIEFELPPGHVLLRAWLNSRPIAASAQQGPIEIEVFAARAGQIGGALELVLSASDRDYLRAGRLALVLPRPSWRTTELTLSAHLPAAFDCAWTSGTLSPAKSSFEGKYVDDLPLPGQALYFRQFLVHRSTPSLTLEYAVSLGGALLSRRWLKAWQRR